MPSGIEIIFSLEVDARVDDRIGQVADQLHDQPQQREEIERGEHDRVIAGQRRLVSEQPEPVERKDYLSQQRAGEQNADDSAGKAGNDDQHGVAEHLTV